MGESSSEFCLLVPLVSYLLDNVAALERERKVPRGHKVSDDVEEDLCASEGNNAIRNMLMLGIAVRKTALVAKAQYLQHKRRRKWEIFDDFSRLEERTISRG